MLQTAFYGILFLLSGTFAASTHRVSQICLSDWKKKEARFHELRRIRMTRQCKSGLESYDNNIPEWFCENMRRLPPTVPGDGPKWSCGIGAFAKQDPPPSVLSMGCSGEIDWERAIRGWLPHSEINVIDPSGRDGGWDAERTIETFRPMNITLHEFWVGSTNMQNHRFPVLAMPEILKKFGYEKKPIDIFKVDIEGHEWHGLTQYIDDGTLRFHHLNIELHNMNCDEHIPFFAALDKHDYRIVYKETNHWGCGPSGCIEYTVISREHACNEFAQSHGCPPCSKWLLDVNSTVDRARLFEAN